LTRRATAATSPTDDGDADPAASCGPQAVLHGNVVVRQDRLDGDAFILGQLRGELEVEHVAGVVLDDVHDARAGVDGLRRSQHLIGHR
jgi:hypothetical protein